MIDTLLQRHDNEDYMAWKLRVIEAKIQKETDMDWSEIKEMLGLDYTSDHIRKMAQGNYETKKYYDELITNNKSNSEVDEINQKIKELEITKIQFQDQKREYRKYLRHEAKLDNLLKKMIDGIKEDMKKKPLHWYKPITKKNDKGALILMLSDLHRGMKADNYWNTFDEKVFDERLNQMVNEVLDYKEILGVDKIHVMELGDAIEGNLHRLTKIGETEDAVEQTKAVAEALSEFTSILANNFSEVHYYNVKGNHDRSSSRKEEEIRTESFHEFIPWYMKVRLEKFENVIFHENEYDSEIIVADIEDNTYFGVHGHLDNYGNVIQNLTMMIKRIPTAVLAGHIHKNFENEVHSVDLIVNNGFAGTNGYAKDKRLTSKAQQKLLWVDKNGRRATFYVRF